MKRNRPQRILLQNEVSEEPLVRDGAPYTGIAFTESPDGILTGNSYRDGRIVEPYHSILASGVQSSLVVDLAATAGWDEEPVLFKGSALSGIGFRFSADHCIYEGLFIEGIETDYVHWGRDGNPRWFTVLHEESNGISEVGRCFNGTSVLDRYRIGSRRGFLGNFSFDPSGAILSSEMRSGFYDQFDRIAALALSFPFTSRQQFLEHAAARSLAVCGNDFTNAILDAFVRFGGLASVSKMMIRNTSVDSFQCLAEMPNLNIVEVETEGAAETTLASLRALARVKDNLLVQLNGVPVRD